MVTPDVLRKKTAAPTVSAAGSAAARWVLAAMLSSASAAYGQQGSPRQTQKPQQGPEQIEQVRKPEPLHPPDIVSDNLDRVSATAEQILQVVDRDPGMMVELKRLFAEDAGTSGQLLEEADLSDAAISERLRQDLHTRVIATRLLQRYGYLLPKVNPDSELAAEHNLEMRARAQELERASESHDAPPAVPQTVITVGAPASGEVSTSRGHPARQPLGDPGGVMNTVSPEMLPGSPEGRLTMVKAGGSAGPRAQSKDGKVWPGGLPEWRGGSGSLAHGSSRWARLRGGAGRQLVHQLMGRYCPAALAHRGSRRTSGVAGSGTLVGIGKVPGRSAGIRAARAANAIPRCFRRCFAAAAAHGARLRCGRSLLARRL